MFKSIALTLLFVGLSKSAAIIDSNTDLVPSETGYAHQYATPVHHYAPVAYGHDAGAADYGKHQQAYGDHGYGVGAARNHYGDAAYGHQGVKAYDDYGSQAAHAGHHGQAGHGYDHGVYQRNRGYG